MEGKPIQSPENQPNNYLELIKWFVIGAVLALLAWLIFWRKRPEKITKAALRDGYSVDKKTFGKWVEIFCSDLIEPAQFKFLRKIPIATADAIRDRLGLPTEISPVFSKQMIVEKSEASYRSLRESIAKSPEKFGLTAENFASLAVFPPRAAARILEHLG